MLSPLTPKQKQILDFINQYYQTNQVSPSLEEIKYHFRLRAVSTVHEHIEKLKVKGYLKKEMNQARGIRTTMPDSVGDRLREVNILGTIAAGQPIEAIEDPEPILVDVDMLGASGKFFALKVRGESMIEDGIFDGDVVLVRVQQSADEGDTVVAIVEGNGATLKRIYFEKDRVRLQPANSALKPMYYRQVEVRGKVIGLYRRF